MCFSIGGPTRHQLKFLLSRRAVRSCWGEKLLRGTVVIRDFRHEQVLLILYIYTLTNKINKTCFYKKQINENTFS